MCDREHTAVSLWVYTRTGTRTQIWALQKKDVSTQTVFEPLGQIAAERAVFLAEALFCLASSPLSNPWALILWHYFLFRALLVNVPL